MKGLPFELKKRKIIYKEKGFKVSKKHPDYSLQELFNFGVINLDKPKKMYCKQLDNKLVHILETPRIGHAGTLDPMVEGVLPILVQRATKISEIMSNAGKVYEGTLFFHDEVKESDVKKVLKSFVGKIRQFPPKHSAIKRQWRTREIYFIEVLKFKGRYLDFKVGCEAGTYIRTLCVDIGKKIGVGAHMIRLKRTQVASLKLEDSIDFYKLISVYQDYLKTKNESELKKVFITKEQALAHLPKVWVDNDLIFRLKNGSPVFAPGILALESGIEKNEQVAIVSEDNEVLATGTAEMDSEQMRKSNHGLAIKTNKVFIK